MTLAMMPLAAQHGVPIVVETSSSSKITDPKTPGQKVVSRISPTSELEAVGAGALIPKLGMKKIGYMAVNTDWGRGAVVAFGEAFKKNGATSRRRVRGPGRHRLLRPAHQVQGGRRRQRRHHRRRAEDGQDAPADEGAGSRRQGAGDGRLRLARLHRPVGGCEGG
jgi:hypothetical protein